ncbi:hypothetical protein QTV43_000028 [Vibrio vulnificus]|nr:hypothetical protein [Vibrio vulnificus]
MHLNVWDKNPSDVRLYVNGYGFEKKPFIKLSRGKPVIINAQDYEKDLIRSEFPDLFTGLTLSVSEFKSFGSKGRTSGGNSTNKRDFALQGIQNYIDNSKNIDVNRCQFKAKTLKSLYVLVDTREPSEIYDLFVASPIQEVNLASLPIGDIILGDHKTGAKIIIERKTVSDFSQSILNSHAHDQAERLFELQQNELTEGNDIKVFWLIESGDKPQGMYSALPEVKQMSGMVGYLSGVHDQHILECYSKPHLVYLCLKLIQNHVDKELINKVNSTNGNRGLAERKKALANTDFSDHGVNMGGRQLAELLSVLPNINTKVAANLAATGLSLAQITNLTTDALKAIDGVGDKTAEKIHNMFNKTSY